MDPIKENYGASMTVEVVTPEGTFYSGRAFFVEFPTDEGELGVFPGHAPLFVDLAGGELRIHQRDSLELFAIAGGFAQIMPGGIRMLATFAVAENADNDIEAACRRAKGAMENAASEDPSIVAAELADLRRELVVMAQRQKKKK